MRRIQAIGAAIVLLCMCSVHVEAVTTFGPTPYLSAADTPAGIFAAGQIVHLQDFEAADGPWEVGFTINKGHRIGPNFISGVGVPVTDSVDADDSTIDGDGSTGASWYTPTKDLTITFDEPVAAAGVVWTDGDRLLTNVKVEFIGLENSVIVTTNGGDIADNVFTGTTAEDRFFGALSGASEMITAIRVSIDQGSGIEIDHVQFAQVVPEPSSLWLSLFGIGIWGLFRPRGSG